MKIKLLISMMLAILVSTTARGGDMPGDEPLTAVLLGKVLTQMERTKLKSLGHALLFGANTIESCAYGGEDLLVIDHYCFPKESYPARAISFWSKKFGVIEIYEENLSGVRVVKKDIRINEFPELVSNILSLDFASIDFEMINSVSAKLYDRRNPGCWATNYDQNTQKPTVACIYTNVTRFPAWAKDSARIINGADWNGAFARVSKKLGN